MFFSGVSSVFFVMGLIRFLFMTTSVTSFAAALFRRRRLPPLRRSLLLFTHFVFEELLLRRPVPPIRHLTDEGFIHLIPYCIIDQIIQFLYIECYLVRLQLLQDIIYIIIPNFSSFLLRRVRPLVRRLRRRIRLCILRPSAFFCFSVIFPKCHLYYI